MRWLLPIAVFVAFLPIIPAQAQRHAGGGGRAMASVSRSGGFATHASSGHAFAPRGGGFAPHPSRSGFGSSFHQPGLRPSGLHRQRFDRGGFRDGRRRDHDRDRRFRRGFRDRDCFDCDEWRGYPWWYAAYYDPYWWSDSSSYDEDYERQLALADEMDQRSLEQQRFLHEQDQDVYAAPSESSSRNQVRDQARNGTSENANERDDPAPATVLVFRDQRKKEVQNYAIVGHTLLIFSPQRTEKTPLADLNLVATANANEERGVEFRVPATSEGQ